MKVGDLVTDGQLTGIILDIEETITTKEHFQSVKDNMDEWEGYNEMAEWDRTYTLK